MFNLNSQTFYKNHSEELSKFYNKRYKTFHIIDGNKDSKLLFQENTHYFSTKKNFSVKDLDKDNLYDQLILTNFIENSNDFVEIFQDYQDMLKNDNKVIVTSINTKWTWLVSILSMLKFIKSKRPKNYITKKNN
jgi:precorrin-6B methylase 2